MNRSVPAPSRILKSVLILFALSTVPLQGQSSPEDQATDALQKLAFEEAIELIEKCDADGSAAAKLLHAFRYHTGLGVEIDDNRAVELAAEAAKSEFAQAASLLYWFARIGMLEETDHPDADEWLKRYGQWQAKAEAPVIPENLMVVGKDMHVPNFNPIAIWLRKQAFSGDAVAAYNLWIYMLEGRTGQADLRSAVYWLTEAAERGNITSAVRLASLYEMGLIVPENSILERKYRKIAAENGHAESQYALAQALLEEKKVGEAIAWLNKAADQDYVNALYQLGDLYDDGEQVEQDSGLAFSYFDKGAASGHLRSMHRVAYMTFYGQGVEKDTRAGIQAFQRAIDKGYGFSAHVLGEIHLEGMGGIEVDVEKARALAAKAVSLGEKDGHRTLGKIHEFGLLGEADFEEAFYHYEQLAREGEAFYQVKIGDMLVHGKGIARDLEEGYDWFSLASGKGNRTGRLRCLMMEALGWGTAPSFDSLIEFVEETSGQSPLPLDTHQFLREAFDQDPREIEIQVSGADDAEWERQMQTLLAEQPARRPPAPFRIAKPEYPKLLRLLKLDETVTAIVLIDEEGRVQQVGFEDSPLPQFAKATEAALLQSRYIPAFHDGKPVKSRARQPIPFRYMAMPWMQHAQ